MAFSDDFTGSNGAGLNSSNWLTPTGCLAPTIYNNTARGVGSSTVAILTSCSSNDQYAEGTCLIEAYSGNYGNLGLIVRGASGSKTYYTLSTGIGTDGEGGEWVEVYLNRCNNGSYTWLATYLPASVTSLRLEISGYVLTCKVNGTTEGTYTDTSASKIASGTPGIRFSQNSTYENFASFTSTDLAASGTTVSVPTTSVGTATATPTVTEAETFSVVASALATAVAPTVVNGLLFPLPTTSSAATETTPNVVVDQVVSTPATSSPATAVAPSVQFARTVSTPATSAEAIAATPVVTEVGGALYSDDFNGLTNGAELTGYWKSPGGAGTGLRAYNTTSIRQPSPGTGRSVYQNAISSNQYTQIKLAGGGLQYVKPCVRAATSGTNRYDCAFNYVDEEGWYCVVNKRTPAVTALANELLPFAGSIGSFIRFEATSLGANFPVRLSVYFDGSLALEVWDTTSPINNGYPGLELVRDGVSYATCDDWSASEVDAPPTPCTAEFPSAIAATSGSVGEPVAGTGAFPGKAIVSSGSIGEPVPCTAEFPGKALAVSGNADARISKAKQTAIYPAFTAFGGTDSYTGLAKGQITVNGANSIGYRKGLGDDGVAGDRVFLTVAAGSMLRADTPTDPVSGATLHVTMLSCMNWDYHAGAKAWAAGTYPLYDVVANGGNLYFVRTAGTSVNGPSGTSDDSTDGGTAHWRYIGTASSPSPSGVAFRVRKADDPTLGMSATLSGDYGTIAAKPIWLSGQTWYDGTTRGNPIEEFIVDITTVYNESAQAGTALNLCLECELGDLKWTAELAGNDPMLQWARPRIEVQRWGEVAIAVTDATSCCPTITATPEAETGTVTRIQWGYDEDMTPQSGVFKYATGQSGVIGEGIWTSSPYTLPMLEAQSRVHVEIEVDYGVAGSLVFKRTWKTPQCFAPKLQLLADVYDATTAADPDETAKGLTDLVGPAFGLAAIHGDRWLAFGKKTGGTTLAAATAYARGDRVIHGGYVWWCRVAGTTGSPLTLPETPAQNTASGGVVDGTATFTPDSYGLTPPAYSNVDYKEGNTNDGWGMFVVDCVDSDYKLRRLVASADLTPPTGYTRPFAVPYQVQGYHEEGGHTMYAWPGPGLHLEADDISPLFSDLGGHLYYFLSSHQTNEGYDINLNYFAADGDNGTEVTTGSPQGILLNPKYGFANTTTLYSSTAAPDLRACSSITSTLDWRAGIVHDALPPTLISFVVDGYLRCYRRTYAEQPGVSPEANTLATGATIEQEFAPVSVSNISSVRFCHLLQRDGTHRTILAAIGSGTSWVGSRADDTFTFLDGGGFTRNSGTWATRTDTNIARVWTTETTPFEARGNGTSFNIIAHAPSSSSAAVAIQKTDGTVAFHGADLLLATGGTVSLQPRADFPGTAFTHNRQQRAVSRWPTLPGGGDIGVYATAMQGGIVAFRANGSTLYAQRTRDFLRVSDEVSVDVTDDITEILVGPDNFAEGQAVPVMLNTTGGYRMVLVTIDMDLTKMHLPSYDLVHRFQSGALTTANIQKDTGNQRAPEEFQHLPGHNVFSTGWRFDVQSSGAYVTNQYGIMNETGWNYFKVTGCEGERMKFIVYDTPGFGFKWRAGSPRYMTLDAAYQPEFAGGAEWCNLKFSTWFWTTDPPSGQRTWRRLLDGMDYVLDGESNGGCYVLNIQAPADTLWLSHDMVSDVATWKGDIAYFQSIDSNGYMKWVNANGELLYGIGPNANQPLSQVAVMP